VCEGGGGAEGAGDGSGASGSGMAGSDMQIMYAKSDGDVPVKKPPVLRKQGKIL
jgi:hypothetical protein